MGFLSFSVFSLWMLAVAGAQTTVHSEVDAINKIIKYFNLGRELNFTGVDPCLPKATWASDSANPRIACECSKDACHITRLKIYALDISGEIPQELFSLTELKDLNLGQNVLSGSISPAIGKLSNMEWLTFGINNLTGPLPAELGNLTKLRSLSLSSNRFQGTLPPELENLTSLQQLYIDSSGLSGSFPESLSNWKSLQILWASDNNFTGKIPDFFGSFTGFKDLRLEGTNLEGPIPSSFCHLTNLYNLRICGLGASESSLDFLKNLTKLSTLSLRNCQIVGQIPEKLSSFPNLMVLDLSFNKLTGRIPASFKKSTKLEHLFLGSNGLSGSLNTDLIPEQLSALDVSFNPLMIGSLPLDRINVSINVVGTSITDANLNKTVADMLHCLQGSTKCRTTPYSSFAVSCGGVNQSTTNKIEYDRDNQTLGAASLYASPNSRWAISNNGIFLSNPHGSLDRAQTDSQILNTEDSELYKKARISASSLRYFGLGLKNGEYKVDLHFAEIQMTDYSSKSWKGLGRRLFDVSIQGERVLQDFNILDEAGGSNTALVKSFKAIVTNTVMDIHLFWAGKGTCCIPFQSTFGPLISAVHVTPTSGV